jgi:hypothetical protein
MTQYLIFQLDFENPKHRDLTFMSSREIADISDEYDLVGVIHADSLADVFYKSNIGGRELEKNIYRVGEMSSVSVGDIVVSLENDQAYVCALYGWDEIEMKVAVQ